MYFNAETQARVLARFHFALNNNGFLFVGKAEMLLAHTNLFTPVNLKHRIFAKMPKTGLRDHLLVLAEARKTEADIHLVKSMRLRDEAFECLSIAQITVDVQGNLALVNRQARVLLGLTLQDQGRPLRDLKLSFQSAEVRSRIQQAYAERQPIQVNNVELSSPAKKTLLYLDIEVIPLLDTNSEPLGVTVIFKDVTRYQQLQQDLLRSTAGQETAYKEFQSTPEELETTNSDA
jgi:two-component system CheB/CheR fusion protein